VFGLRYESGLGIVPRMVRVKECCMLFLVPFVRVDITTLRLGLGLELAFGLRLESRLGLGLGFDGYGYG
jgi:hypothetical protein